MTPEREKYLAKCSEREQLIRMLIKYHKYELKKAKAVCSSYDLKKIGRKPFGYRLHIEMVKQYKVIISALYHELNHIKGMNRVVVPKVTYVGKCNDTFMQRVERCTCGERLMGENYCPECGRRILWKKVK